MTNNIAPLVLAVDDDPNFLEVIVAKLESQGFKIATATDGNEAIAKAKGLKPDLILMDVEMPNKDGLSTVADLSQDPNTKHIPVIFLTNMREEAVEPLAERISLHIDSQHYFKKEDDYNTLMGKIRHAVAA